MGRQRNNGPQQVAVAFEDAGGRRVMVTLAATPGRTGPRRARLGLQPDEPSARSARWVGLAPWARSLVRCRPIEGIDGEALPAALAVLGEGELPERIPAWRRACGALRSPNGSRTAVLTAWLDDPPQPGAPSPAPPDVANGDPTVRANAADGHRGNEPATPDPRSPKDNRTADIPSDACYATVGAALGLGVALGGGCAFAGDAQQGVLVVAACGPQGLTVRSVREDPGVVCSDRFVARRLAEAARAVGLASAETIQAPGQAAPGHAEPSAEPDRLIASVLAQSAQPWPGRRVGYSSSVEQALSQAVEGWPTDRQAAAEAMLPTLAGLLALSQDPAESALASLRAREPARRATPLERLDGWLCRPGRVAALCVGLVAIALLAPLLAAQARVALLKGKIERAEALRSTFQAQARQAAIYRQLNERVWPMTKLMAEVAAAAPVHVVLDSVRLDSTGQIDLEGFVQIVPEGPGVQGPPESLVTRYESALNALGTLGPVTVVRREVVGDSVQFQVAAQVRNALARANLPMDYAQMPLAEVLYGPGARNDASPRPAALASGRGSPGRASAVRPGGSSPASAMASPASTASTVARDAGQRDQAIEGARQAAGQRRPTGDVPPASENGVPTPLTDEQIAAMDRQTAMREWSTRRSASRDASLDAETRARLAAEAEKLNAHFKALGSGG